MPVVQQYPVYLYCAAIPRRPRFACLLRGGLTSSALGKRYEMGPYVEQGTTLYISRGIGLEGLSAPHAAVLPTGDYLFTLEGRE